MPLPPKNYGQAFNTRNGFFKLEWLTDAKGADGKPVLVHAGEFWLLKAFYQKSSSRGTLRRTRAQQTPRWQQVAIFPTIEKARRFARSKDYGPETIRAARREALSRGAAHGRAESRGAAASPQKLLHGDLPRGRSAVRVDEQREHVLRETRAGLVPAPRLRAKHKEILTKLWAGGRLIPPWTAHLNYSMKMYQLRPKNGRPHQYDRIRKPVIEDMKSLNLLELNRDGYISEIRPTKYAEENYRTPQAPSVAAQAQVSRGAAGARTEDRGHVRRVSEHAEACDVRQAKTSGRRAPPRQARRGTGKPRTHVVTDYWGKRLGVHKVCVLTKKQTEIVAALNRGCRLAKRFLPRYREHYVIKVPNRGAFLGYQTHQYVECSKALITRMRETGVLVNTLYRRRFTLRPTTPYKKIRL